MRQVGHVRQLVRPLDENVEVQIRVVWDHFVLMNNDLLYQLMAECLLWFLLILDLVLPFSLLSFDFVSSAHFVKALQISIINVKRVHVLDLKVDASEVQRCISHRQLHLAVHNLSQLKKRLFCRVSPVLAF